jgi:hypothetical protein
MTIPQKPRPLKVCATCRHWSYKYKGLCALLNQGVGKFWTCEKWLAVADPPLPQDRRAETPKPAAP